MTTRLDVAVCFDEGYAEHAAVTVASVLQSGTLEDCEVRAWVAAEPDYVAKAVGVVRRAAQARAPVFGVSPRLPELPMHWSADAAHVTGAMYQRLGLVDALPSDVQRVLYLDCDTLCLESLAQLAELELGDAVVAAVRDGFTRRIVDRGGLPGWTRYPQISGQASYFNSGVLLMDTGAWRSHDITPRAVEYLLENADHLRYPDQDALNVACAGAWLRLPARWNHMMPWRLEGANGGSLGDASIVHCAGPRKWWTPGYPEGDLTTLYRSLRRTRESATTRRAVERTAPTAT